MRRASTALRRCAIPLSLLAAASTALATVNPIAFYRLGDDDPGAAPGNVGNDPTLDHSLNHFDLSRAGQPHYSADVPLNVPTAAYSVGSGNKLSMQFFNFTGPLAIPQPLPNYYYRTTPLSAPNTGFGMEAWVKSSPLGQGDANGYTLISYSGTPFVDGAGFFQHGKNYVLRIGSSFEKILAPASTQTWTHLGFVRWSAANSFYLDGMAEPDSSTAAQTAPSGIGKSFYIGGFGNPLSMTPVQPQYLFNGLVDNARLFGFSPLTTSFAAGELLINNIPRDLKWAGASSTWGGGTFSWTDSATATAVTWQNSAPDNATFGAGAASTNVSLAAPMSVGKITFDAGAPAYSLGGGSISIAAPLGSGIAANQSASITSPIDLLNDQDWNVAAGATLTASGAITDAGLSKSGGGKLAVTSISNDSVSVNEGMLVVQAGGTIQTNSIAVTAGGKLDLGTGRLTVHNGDAGSWNGSGYTGLSGMIAAGSITSSSVGATTTLGVAAGAGGDAIVAYTFAGDANLDGRINADDYFAIDSNLNKPGSASYSHGDFNYDGTINGDDYFLIDSNFGSPPLGGPAGNALTAVPEPALSSVAALSLLGLRRRRR